MKSDASGLVSLWLALQRTLLKAHVSNLRSLSVCYSSSSYCCHAELDPASHCSFFTHLNNHHRIVFSTFFSWKKKVEQKSSRQARTAPRVLPPTHSNTQLLSLTCTYLLENSRSSYSNNLFQKLIVWLFSCATDYRRCIPLPFPELQSCTKFTRDKALYHSVLFCC